MAERLIPKGCFDIPDIPDWVPRKVKPWIFIFFVLVIQFSGGVYLAATSHMVGSTALMTEDILMAGYAQLIGMSINFCVMFRLKFRFSNKVGLLICCSALVAANIICAITDNVFILVSTCLLAGWFRMWATLLCNSTIQLWLTPVRDMAIFFCYVYIVVDGVIQLSGISTIYTAFFSQWEYMHCFMIGALVFIMIVIALLKPCHAMAKIPLLGIDWIGAVLWAIFMLCFTFICMYGNFYDWWESKNIIFATLLGVATLAINLWRASFLHHPYISFRSMKNHNVIRASFIYLIFFTLLATEHVFEESYAVNILHFDDLNVIQLNWYALAGIIFGVILTYLTFATRKWKYKTLTAIAFLFATIYLAYFYFFIDYNLDKQMLFIPLFCRGCASVIISTIYLTSIVQSGLPFQVFPQALTINGFTGAVMGATFGPAIIGEFLSHTMAKNAALISASFTASNPAVSQWNIADLYGLVQNQAFIVSIKEIFGWLLLATVILLIIIGLSYSSLRPKAIFPKWKTIRKIFRRESQSLSTSE